MNKQKFNEKQDDEVVVVIKESKKSAMATAGLVVGIVGIATSFIPIVNNASFVLGILATIFGIIALVKRKSTAKSVTALVLGVLAIVITLAMQAAWSNAIDDAFGELEEDMDYLSGDKTDDVLNNYLSVKLGSFKVMEDEYFDATELSVTLTNKGTEKKSFSVTIEAVDKNGNRIVTDTVYASDLGVGQSQSFKAFQFVSDEDIAALKRATFRVSTASMY